VEQPGSEGLSDCSVACVRVSTPGSGARPGVPAWGGLGTVQGTTEPVESPDSRSHSPEGGEALKEEILCPTWRDGDGLNGKFPIWRRWLLSCFSGQF